VTTILTAMAILMPVALSWTVMLTLRTAQRLKAEAEHLQGSIDALRHAQVALNQMVGMPVRHRHAPAPAMAGRPVASRPAKPGPARNPISTRPPIAITAAPSDPQPRLELEPAAAPARAPISLEDFIRALNFPNDENDRDGFRALRRAAEDPDAGKLVRASQDILTLLSQDGIYMDDLVPDRARPEIWRQFAAGERGRPVAALGGVRDRAPLAQVTTRMREDLIFRDAAHHFLRYFDMTFADFAIEASDQDISDLSETRTARAFMLLGRASGTFD
jgi:hypothetical protein